MCHKVKIGNRSFLCGPAERWPLSNSSPWSGTKQTLAGFGIEVVRQSVANGKRAHLQRFAHTLLTPFGSVGVPRRKDRHASI